MTATNHALTGAFIGLSVANLPLAIAIAFCSHFFLDVLPHYGSRKPDEVYIISKSFKWLLIVDIIVCFLLVVVLALLRPHNWLVAATCAFVATLPDAIYLPTFIRTKRGSAYPEKANWFAEWSRKIQWFQRPPGAIVEIAWAIAAGMVLHVYL